MFLDEKTSVLIRHYRSPISPVRGCSPLDLLRFRKLPRRDLAVPFVCAIPCLLFVILATNAHRRIRVSEKGPSRYHNVGETPVSQIQYVISSLSAVWIAVFVLRD